MRRAVVLFSVIFFFAVESFCADSALSPPASGFEGVWLGEITAPNTRTTFGLAFTPTAKGLLVSVYMPEMFLYGVNFGPADIHDNVFELTALNLHVARENDKLTGTFAIGGLPLVLQRGGSFGEEPPSPEFPAPPAAAWIHELGAPAWAAPVTRDGILYVGTIDGKFHAVGADHGEKIWTWSGAAPLFGEALVTDDSVFFVDENGVLNSLARATGQLKWQMPLYDEKLSGGPAPKNETFNHRTVVPVTDGKGTLYIGSADRGVYAVKASNGKKLWRYDAKTRIYAPVALNGDDLLVGGFDGTLFSLNRSTHRETMQTKLGGPIVSAPVVADGQIVVGCRDYFLYGLNQKTSRIDWRDAFWFSWVESTPRLADGIIYVGGSDFRRVSAIDPATGHTQWATDVRGLSWGSPVVTTDVVYAGTVGQNIAGTVIKHSGGVVALDRKTGVVKWRYVAPVPDGAEFTGFAGSLVDAAGKVIGASVSGQMIAFPREGVSQPLARTLE